MTPPAPSDSPGCGPGWPTPAGTIRKGMKVIAPDGSHLGTVETLDGEELMLSGGDGRSFVATTLIDGVSGDTVLLAARGDSTFGLGAEP